MTTHREQDVWWRSARALADPLAHGLFRIRYAGLKHIPAQGPAILAGNHISMLDPILIALAAHRRGRVTRWLGIAEAFRWAGIGWILDRLNQIPLRRGEGDASALQEAQDTLERGRVVGIFPEGRVGVAGAELQRGRTGVARLAAGGAPVIPVGIWGTHLRWRREGLTLAPPLRPEVWVAFGAPVPDTAGARTRAELQSVADRVMEHIGDQLDRIRAAERRLSD